MIRFIQYCLPVILLDNLRRFRPRGPIRSAEKGKFVGPWGKEYWQELGSVPLDVLADPAIHTFNMETRGCSGRRVFELSWNILRLLF